MKRAGEILDSFLHLDEKDDGILSQLMFFVPLGLWILARLFLKESAVAGPLHGIVTYTQVRMACFACLAVRELIFGRWDRLAVLGAFLMGFMGAMTYLAKFTVAFDTIVFVFAGRNIRFRRLVAFMFCTLSFAVVVIVGLAVLGAIPDTVLMRGSVERHHLGFAHPNKGPGAFLFIACSWIYLRGKKYGPVDMLAILAITATLYHFTDSRTACAVSAAAAVLAFAIKWVPDRVLRSRILTVLGVGSVVICALVSIAVTICYDPTVEWMRVLDTFLSGRLTLGHAAIVNHGIPLLGQKVDSGMMGSYDVVAGVWKAANRTTTTIIDCEYVRFLVACGWPFMVIALVLCTLVCARARKREEWTLLLLIALIAIHGISENYGPFGFYNPFIYLIGGLFASGKREGVATLGRSRRSGSHARRTLP